MRRESRIEACPVVCVKPVEAGSEVELLPGVPPGVGSRDDGASVEELDTMPVTEAIGLRRVLELGLHLARAAGVVRGDSFQVGECQSRTVLDELTRTSR